MTAENNRPALLLVEDDAEIREQIKWALGPQHMEATMFSGTCSLASWIWLNLAIALVVTAACFAAPAFPQSLSDAPALPQVYLDTTYAPPTGGMTITINAGGDLQEALNNATCGDTIRLQAGGTFTGPFILPNKPCTDWIYIRPDTADSNLPPPGTRITPSYANVMPKIVGTGMPVIALQTSAMAHHFRFIGIEFIPQSGTYATSLIRLGAGETDAVLLPHDIVFDRCYIHGDPTVGGRRGIALNSARTAVVDSYFSDWKENGGESQAVAGWNGSGPFKIVNNYVEAAAVNLMFGGADPSIPNLVPSDIEIRNNYFFKPLSWKGSSWTVKNLFELKNAQRVLVEGNVFENIWTAAQDGAAIVMKSANQDGTAPWSTVRDITFRKNIIRRASVGIRTAGIAQGPAMPSVRILVQDNLIIVDPSLGLGRPFAFYNDTQDITVDHNTTDGSGDFLIAADACPPTQPRFIFLNNIAPHNTYGVKGSGLGVGISTLSACFPSYVFTNNAIVGPDASSIYPPNNFWPVTLSDVGFINLTIGDYHLTATSPYKNAGKDGRDLGADIDALNAATACATSGTCGAPLPPPPGDTTPQTVSITAPTSGAIVSGVVAVSASASDNVGVVGVQFKLDGANLGAEVTAAPYAVFWYTFAANGAHTLSAVARDVAGRVTTSSEVNVTVANPTVSIIAPLDGATLNDLTKVRVHAASEIGLSSILIYSDSILVGTLSCTGNSCLETMNTVSWVTNGLATGPHFLYAVATDIFGNSSSSTPITVNK